MTEAPKPRLRVLVCGGRDFADRALLFTTLDRLHAEKPVAVLIEGGARGADRLAVAWAVARGVPIESYPADWKRHGNSAGPRRNADMLRLGRPDQVVAFPTGGPGTRDMMRQATAAGVRVVVVEALETTFLAAASGIRGLRDC